MAKFKCIHTGNEFTFNDVDSIEMRKHDEYTEVVEVVTAAPVKPVTTSKKQLPVKE